MDRTSYFRRALRAAPALGLMLATAPLMAQSGPIDTLPLGKYECTLPGDAGGAAWHRLPERDFTILNASSYEAGGERGVYLLRGTQVSFTRGPFKGMMLERSGRRILRERDENGELGPMRCVRTSPPS